jgi:hypothetical protein
MNANGPNNDREDEVKRFIEYFVASDDEVKERYVLRVYLNHVFPNKDKV